MTTIAERLFEAHFQIGSAEEELSELLENAGVPFDDIGWDWYDCSLELVKVTSEYRLSAEAQKIIYDAGFQKAYINHTDSWETHYSFNLKEPFKEVDGWRVSYPGKRGDGTQPVWVEKVVPSWPPEWFETGYCVVKES